MSRLILSCENKQELSDLLTIAQALHDTYGHEIYYFNITSLLSGGEGEPADSALFKKKWYAKAIKGRAFKTLPVWLKLLASLINAFYLVFQYYAWRVDFVLVGTPLLTYRLARMMTFGNMRLVTYIRGVIAYSDENTSVSSRIFVKSKRLMHYAAFASVLSDYYADLVICTGEVTADFVASRGVPRKNIKVIGSVYCDGLVGVKGVEGEKTIVFVSSAFAFHGYDDAQNAQGALIREIRQYISATYKNVQFVVRRHPREASSFYEGDLAECVDNSVGDPLSSYPSNSLFLSPISTLIFEVAYLGRQGVIIADDFFVHRFSSWYEAVGLSPVLEWKSVLDGYISNRGVVIEQEFSKSISSEFKGRVVERIVEQI